MLKATKLLGDRDITETRTSVVVPTQPGASAAILPPLAEDVARVPTMTIGVVGLGYVGLPTALSLREAGHRVVGLDSSAARIAAIRAIDVDLLPVGMAALKARAADPELVLTTAPSLLAECDAVIVCVPTPVTHRLVPDLGPLRVACETVVRHARIGQVVILTSTTYVGCTRELLEGPLRQRGLIPGEDVFVAFSPERIDPGVADHSPASTPRVVGGLTDRCLKEATRALSGTCPTLHAVSSPEAAELTKLLENTFRAVNISMINEFSDVAQAMDLDITEVIDAAATKPYGFTAFRPGPGVGGHCIPCDPHYLLWQLQGERVQAPVIAAAMTGIARRPHTVADRAREVLAGAGLTMQQAHVHVVGIAYKPDVADVRESPALRILTELRSQGAQVSYSDHHVPRVDLGADVLVHQHPQDVPADLYLVHTRHSDVDLTWLRGERVLDATYTLAGLDAEVV